MASIAEISPDNLDAYIKLIPDILQQHAVEYKDMRFFGIEEGGEASGAIAIREKADVADIRYMYIVPDYRGSGLIDQALANLFLDLKEEGYGSVSFNYIPDVYPVFSHISERFGFLETRLDYAYFRFRAADIKKCKAASFAPQGIIRLQYLPVDKRERLFRIIEKSFDTYGVKMGRQEEILPYSMAYMEGENPKGALVVETPNIRTVPTTDDIQKYPEPGAYDMTLFFVGTTAQKAPLQLLSGLCRVVDKELGDDVTMTGYFPEGHVVRLLEGALGIKGHHEVRATLDLADL